VKQWILVGALLLGATAQADEHYFGYVKTADALPKGGAEFEQWITNRSGKANQVYSKWILREELEYGITDTVTGALYLNFADLYQSVLDEDPASPTYGSALTTEETLFEGINVELKWQLINPAKSPIGLQLYYEPGFGHGEWEHEVKVIASSETESWVTAINLTAEPEWERDALTQSEELNLEVTAGLAYKATPVLSFGLEGRMHTEIPEFLHNGVQEHTAYFLGPAFRYAEERFNIALTVLPQLRGMAKTKRVSNISCSSRCRPSDSLSVTGQPRSWGRTVSAMLKRSSA
jgi:hypothetical protein